MNDTEQRVRAPANENAWYCLATLYGEVTENADPSLSSKNRFAWNRWMAGELKEERRDELVGLGFERAELIPLAGSELREFLACYKNRTSLPLPEFEGTLDFSNSYFDCPLIFSKFVFPGILKFNNCFFEKFVHLFGCYVPGLDISNSVFEDIFLCDGANISGGIVLFMGADFKKWCSTERLKSVKIGNFNSLKCRDGFRLDSSVFDLDGVVTFDRGLFDGPASFKNVSFPVSSFSNAVFSNNVSFCGSVFNESVSFNQAEFMAESDFNTCNFRSSATFRLSKFEKSVPTIFNTKFCELVEFLGY